MALQAQEEPAIRWEPGLELSWSDFRGTPPESRRIAATTASGISYAYNATWNGLGYVLDLEVEAHFYPEKSWYHPEICDQGVLAHEQLHFDITALFARRLRARLESRVYGDDLQAEVRHMFAEVNRELAAFQERYDRETDFSRDPEAQGRWGQEVAALLAVE